MFSLAPGETLCVSPRSLLRQALEQLSPHKEESKRIKKAVKEIRKSLDDKLWLDEFHLDSKQGHKMFSRTGDAVKELTHLLESKRKDKNASPEAQQ